MSVKCLVVIDVVGYSSATLLELNFTKKIWITQSASSIAASVHSLNSNA